MGRKAYEKTVERIARDPRFKGRASEDSIRKAVAPIAADADRKAAAEGSSYRPSDDTRKPIPKAREREHRIDLSEVPAAEPLVHDLNRRHGLAAPRAAIIRPSTARDRKIAAEGFRKQLEDARAMLERKK